MKKYVWWSTIVAVLLIIGAFLLGRYTFPNMVPGNLPKPELAEGNAVNLVQIRILMKKRLTRILEEVMRCIVT